LILIIIYYHIERININFHNISYKIEKYCKFFACIHSDNPGYQKLIDANDWKFARSTAIMEYIPFLGDYPLIL